MAKALPIKTKRQSTAAYAASQPLFDALRNGMELVAEQRDNLRIARDMVQKLHVKLPTESVGDDARDSHEKYMDSAVKAWRLATESYAQIFEALANVTAAEPSAGREKREGHEAFAKMANTAKEAHEVAMDWKLTTPRSSVGTEATTGRSVDEDARMEDATTSASEAEQDLSGATSSTGTKAKEAQATTGDVASADNKPTNPVLMSLLKQQPLPEAGEGRDKKKLAEDGTKPSNVPDSALGSNEKDPGRAQKRLQRRQKRREKRQIKKAQDATSDGVTTVKPEGNQTAPTSLDDNGKLARNVEHISLDADGEPQPLQPEYEDVSAEVAARLKAKDAKKEVAKEKKRKRESGESIQTSEVNGKAEKPKKKKTKSNLGEAVEDAASKEKARKRELQADGAELAGHGEGRKKRKKG